MVSKVFIANRGEIARRIARTCKKMGIISVGITQDSPPNFLKQYIDQFVDLPNTGTKAFLDQDLLIKKAQESSCDAIHPGFGFLSENADFAEKVEASGMTWIGPSPKTIRVMASKKEARLLAEEHDVPCVPGLEQIDLNNRTNTIEKVRDFGHTVGYPLLIKAALGGGGKGMRLVHEASELDEALSRASSEALNAFGDGTLLVEKFLTKPRHVEVQVLGDNHGHIITLGDRDCSIQRRHQKIIEEAPAVGLSEITRIKLYEAAIKLSRAAHYKNAGTVEFLVDWSNPQNEQPFYFLEMNTRLQVEHPVTEEIFGIDLVSWQIRIARNEIIPENMHHLRPRGHAIEARLYAENPEQNYLPQPGQVHGFFPVNSSGIRWEIGIDQTDKITGSFDPMIAKAVSYAPSRTEAISKLKDGLKQTLLCGIQTNREFLVEILSHPSFIHEIPTTQYLKTNQTDLINSSSQKFNLQSPFLHTKLKKIYQQLIQENTGSPHMNTVRRVFMDDEDDIEIQSSWVNKESQSTTKKGYSHKGDIQWCLHQSSSSNYLYGLWEGVLTNLQYLRHEKPYSELHGSSSLGILSPVPGKVIKSNYNRSDKVEQFQTIIVLESMKMEFEVKAHKAGIIDEVLVSPGDQVDADQVLATWKQ